MSSHEFYLWMSYGATALALAVELGLLAARRARAPIDRIGARP